ncbi:hypothetical protein AKJ08_2734 [Vulgatibacter incomptus]|uniref:Response regulatory domain-containing protein n=1 Tax=Vulgatibacter incomptus TaxID=1391653 RepID=A0A0K1PFR4_9BACT|nr:hypothetical protein AKJ08_2734 [Vulgatibacter incomptus]
MIVVAGHRIIAAGAEAIHLGAINFVRKPVDAPALLPLIKDAIASRLAANHKATIGAAPLGMAAGHRP